MPRQARIDTAGALHHIIVRGIERHKIFDDDIDRYDFLKRLGQILEQTHTACYAWALIPNHFHLLLRTGMEPVATVMRRLLTGHAIGYNRRHHRHGHLFQNRYKSILCQKDAYFLELIRYIHLNPLRAGLVVDINMLDKYPFSGHAGIMGNHRYSWQDYDAVLTHFGKSRGSARTQYRNYVGKGRDQGRRDDLTGGGLIRSTGGWAAVKTMRKANIHIKSDERILGDSEFVSEILRTAEESLEHRHLLENQGIDLDYIAARVAELLKMPVEDVWSRGRYRRIIEARSLLCFWAVRELGESMTAMARRLDISTVAVSKSVKRGGDLAKKENYSLLQ
jgi:putative transposase